MRTPLVILCAVGTALTLAAASAAPPRLPIALVAISLDSTRHGQSRYVDLLIEKAGEPSAWFEYQPAQLAEDDLVRCMESDLRGAETCVRFILAEKDLKAARPVHVVVITGPGPEDSREALTDVHCIGIGGALHNAERQTITVNPATVRYAGNHAFREDLNALAGCIIAAGAESGW